MDQFLQRKLQFVNESASDVFVTVRSDKVELHETFTDDSGAKVDVCVSDDSTVPHNFKKLDIKGTTKFQKAELGYNKSQKYNRHLKWEKHCPVGEFSVPSGQTVQFTLESNVVFGSTAYCTVRLDEKKEKQNEQKDVKDQRLLCKDFAVHAGVLYFRKNCIYEYSERLICYGDTVSLYNNANRGYLTVLTPSEDRLAALTDSVYLFRVIPVDSALMGRPLSSSRPLRLAFGNLLMCPFHWPAFTRTIHIGVRKIRFVEESKFHGKVEQDLVQWKLGRLSEDPFGDGWVRDGESISLCSVKFPCSYLRAVDEIGVMHQRKASKKRWWTIRKVDLAGASQPGPSTAASVDETAEVESPKDEKQGTMIPLQVRGFP